MNLDTVVIISHGIREKQQLKPNSSVATKRLGKITKTTLLGKEFKFPAVTHSATPPVGALNITLYMGLKLLLI